MDRQQALAIVAETFAAIAECRETITEETCISDVINAGRESILVFSKLHDREVIFGGTGENISIVDGYTVGDLLNDFEHV